MKKGQELVFAQVRKVVTSRTEQDFVKGTELDPFDARDILKHFNKAAQKKKFVVNMPTAKEARITHIGDPNSGLSIKWDGSNFSLPLAKFF